MWRIFASRIAPMGTLPAVRSREPKEGEEKKEDQMGVGRERSDVSRPMSIRATGTAVEICLLLLQRRTENSLVMPDQKH